MIKPTSGPAWEQLVVEVGLERATSMTDENYIAHEQFKIPGVIHIPTPIVDPQTRPNPDTPIFSPVSDNAARNLAAGMPAVGTPAWLALMEETDGAAANPNFNYPAHIAAKNGTEPIVTTTVGNVTTTVVNLSQRAFASFNPSGLAEVPLPPFGSPEYKAILLETGRDDLIGFNYAAHIAAKANVSLSNFDTYFNASSGADLVSLLGQVNVNELMASASPLQVQALVTKFAGDPAFSAYLNSQTALTVPSVGSAAYDALLKQTGRTNLEGFDYEAHVKAITEATQLISQVGLADLLGVVNEYTGSAKNEVIRAAGEGEALLVAGAGNDTVIGGEGDDILIGGEGNDRMSGLAGNDLYYVDSVRDRVTELVGGGDDTIVALIDVKLPNQVENVILLEGDIGASGNSVSNDIKGNEGMNRIDGGLGSDILTGGAGKDSFVFSSKLSTSNIDVITDFNDDALLLSGKVFSKLRGATDLSSLFAIGQAQDANDFLIYDNGILYYDIDGSGLKPAVAIVALTGKPELTELQIQLF